ncbi:PREDICTED: uncharacterized protein LOC106539309 [Thamnophis sirtalis]|uniref:Uncharacterized protein LOC106539309 n=1 Tax=Thamnophis sirtalis TaxID=35019 RepID=A0A6I9X2Q6_9SAUR|nr:PREDICTED: uncharacterized protein LOC106539309 [Thamnophis sirtalis]
MSQLQLLRRPLSPKTETEQYIPKKKCTKAVREKEKEPEKVLGDVDSQTPPPEKNQSISLCFPDDDFSVQPPYPVKRDFVIPVFLTGPPSFPMQNRRAPMRLQHPTLHPSHLPTDFVVSGVTMVTSPLPSVTQKYVPKKPFISRYNCEVFSNKLIAKEMKGPEKVAIIYLKLSESDRALESPELEEEMDFIKSFISGAGYDTELSALERANEFLQKAEMAVLFCIMHRKTGLSLKKTSLCLELLVRNTL